MEKQLKDKMVSSHFCRVRGHPVNIAVWLTGPWPLRGGARTHILPAIGWRGRFEFVSALSTARNCVAAAGIQFHLVLKKVQKTNQKEKIEEKKRVNEANDIAR